MAIRLRCWRESRPVHTSVGWPYAIATIGVITSPTGAVIRDILHRIAERWPCRVVVWPVVVQGEAASGQRKPPATVKATTKPASITAAKVADVA